MVRISTCCKMRLLLDIAGVRGTLKRQISNSEMLSEQCWRVAPLWSGWACNRLLPAVSYTGKWRRLTTRLAGLPASHGRSPKESRRPSKCTVAHPTPLQPTPALHEKYHHPNLEFSHFSKKKKKVPPCCIAVCSSIQILFYLFLKFCQIIQETRCTNSWNKKYIYFVTSAACFGLIGCIQGYRNLNIHAIKRSHLRA